MPAMLYKSSLYDDTCLLNEIINTSVFIVNKYMSSQWPDVIHINSSTAYLSKACRGKYTLNFKGKTENLHQFRAFLINLYFEMLKNGRKRSLLKQQKKQNFFP